MTSVTSDGGGCRVGFKKVHGVIFAERPLLLVLVPSSGLTMCYSNFYFYPQSQWLDLRPCQTSVQSNKLFYVSFHTDGVDTAPDALRAFTYSVTHECIADLKLSVTQCSVKK